MKIAAVVVMIACAAGTAFADEIKHPKGFNFDLPKIGKAWEQEVKGDVVIVGDESDSLPELQIFVFPAGKEGTLAEIEGRLQSELAHPGVSLAGEAIKTVKVAPDAKTESVADASVRSGTVTLNGGDKAAFAIVQRRNQSMILLGVPGPGIFERGAVNFRQVVKGLQWAPRDTASRLGGSVGPAKPAPKPGAATLPKLPTLVAIKDVTATTTFVDKKHKDAYAPWRTIEYASVEDGATSVPATAWCEGKDDEGIGEALTITFGAPSQIDTLKIAAGVWRSAKLFAANNQITALDVSLDGKSTTVKPAADRAWAEVPVGRAVSTIVVKIAAVKKGKMNDSCLSGIELVRDKQPVIAVRGLDGAAATALPVALSKVQSTLESPGRPGLKDLIDFPFVVHPASGFFNGAPKPVKHASWKALDAACRAADKKAESGEVDESKPVTCPRSATVDPADDRPANVMATGAGMLEVSFPSHREVQEVWRLRWRDGAWRLTAIDYE